MTMPIIFLTFLFKFILDVMSTAAYLSVEKSAKHPAERSRFWRGQTICHLINAGLFLTFTFGTPLGLFAILVIGFLFLEIAINLHGMVTACQTVKQHVGRISKTLGISLNILKTLNFGVIVITFVPLFWILMNIQTNFVLVPLRPVSLLLAAIAIGYFLLVAHAAMAAKSQ